MQCTLASATLQVVSSAQQRVAKTSPAARPLGLRVARPALRTVAAKATDKPADFDAFLELTAEKWEKASNKPVVGGYLVGAVAAIFVAEWLIHLPLFNVLLGFPIQFIGLLACINLGINYYVEKDGDAWTDAEALVKKVSKQLPGLGK